MSILNRSKESVHPVDRKVAKALDAQCYLMALDETARRAAAQKAPNTLISWGIMIKGVNLDHNAEN